MSEKETQFGKWVLENPMIPGVSISNCPISTATLGVLGRKWTLLILRDIGMRKQERFTDLLNSVEGITRRVLSMRLRELEDDGIISKQIDGLDKPHRIRWRLTEKGWDALPILMSYVAFGSKWYSSEVFPDKIPKEVREVFPQRQLKGTYVNLEISRDI